jgi:hypothetical protein
MALSQLRQLPAAFSLPKFSFNLRAVSVWFVVGKKWHRESFCVSTLVLSCQMSFHQCPISINLSSRAWKMSPLEIAAPKDTLSPSPWRYLCVNCSSGCVYVASSGLASGFVISRASWWQCHCQFLFLGLHNRHIKGRGNEVKVVKLFDVGGWLVSSGVGVCQSPRKLSTDSGLHAKLGQGSAPQRIPGMRLRNEQPTLLCKT